MRSKPLSRCKAASQLPSRPRQRAFGRRRVISSTLSFENPTEAPSASADLHWESGRLKWRKAAPPARIEALPSTPPIVILPGFGNCTQDYTKGLGNPSNTLVTGLQEQGDTGLSERQGQDMAQNRGFQAQVVEVKRTDWLKALRGVFTRKYWQQQSLPGACYGWYLCRVQEAVNRARQESGSEQVILLGHSAGGWLGRAFMADPLYFETPAAEPDAPHQAVAQLVTLGTPHCAPASELARDMTGGALTWVNRTYPGAHFQHTHGVRYVCVAGRTVRGDQRAKGSSLERYSHNSYKQVCGQGNGVEGDGVVPYQSAILAGAQNIILDGVYHSMSQVGSFSEPSEHIWYGSDSVLDHWLQHVALT